MQPNRPEIIPQYSNRQVIYATLSVAAIILLFLLLYRFIQIVFILFIAIVLGTAIRPIVNWLNRRGLPRKVGVVVVYISLACLAAGFIVLLIPLFHTTNPGNHQQFTHLLR